MANELNNYKQEVISPSDYLKILRLYTAQHILPDGRINLVENYDPNLGGPIVYYYWSNHYLHSTFNNLVITGLCGIRPSEGDTLTINPLIDSSIKYFCLRDINYHGHQLTVAYDADGSRYKSGKGLMVWVDGKKQPVNEKRMVIGPAVHQPKTVLPANFALNITRKGYPKPSSSVKENSDTALYKPIDGRIWFFPEISNYWRTNGLKNGSDSYTIHFGESKKLSAIKLYFFVNDKEYFLPDAIRFATTDSIPIIVQMPAKLSPNTVNTFHFEALEATGISLTFEHSKGQVALVELEMF